MACFDEQLQRAQSIVVKRVNACLRLPVEARGAGLKQGELVSSDNLDVPFRLVLTCLIPRHCAGAADIQVSHLLTAMWKMFLAYLQSAAPMAHVTLAE
jgi:hypothetical protein